MTGNIPSNSSNSSQGEFNFDILEARLNIAYLPQPIPARRDSEISELLSQAEWFCAYFGTYTLDGKKGVWVTHVLGSNQPNYLGTDQTRSFTLRGDTLVISGSYVAGGKRVQAERTLVREIGSPKRRR